MDERASTYRGLAAKTGSSAGYLNHLVHGNRPVPSNDVVAGLAKALGVEPEHFREFRIRVDHRAARADARPRRPALPAPQEGAGRQPGRRAGRPPLRDPHLEMEVRSDRGSGRADEADERFDRHWPDLASSTRERWAY